MSILPFVIAAALLGGSGSTKASEVRNYGGQLTFAVTSNVDAVSFETELTEFKKMQASVVGGALKNIDMKLDPATFETGLGLRDDHMNEKVFKEQLVNFSFKECAPQSATTCLLKGELEIGDKKNPIELLLNHDADFKNVSGKSTLSLTKLEIEAPNYMGVKVEDKVEVKFKLQSK